MNNLSAFDIIGPVMIGPSSSHTAGACRIGNLAKEIVDNKLKDVKIYFHGSFKETYRGHGTDKAIIGGLLGLKTDDSRIKNSFKLTEKEGFSFEFFPVDLDDVHPNTMKLEITDQEDIKTTIVASSIGGGNIIVTELNGTEVKLNGEYYTLITFHNDQPGLIAKISEILQIYNLNIAEMEVLRKKKGRQATAIINLDQKVEKNILQLLRDIPGIQSLKLVKPFKKYDKTAAQVILRWLIQRDVVVIPKTVHQARMEENFNVFDFELSVEDIEKISELDTGETLFFSHRDPEMVERLGTAELDI